MQFIFIYLFIGQGQYTRQYKNSCRTTHNRQHQEQQQQYLCGNSTYGAVIKKLVKKIIATVNGKDDIDNLKSQEGMVGPTANHEI